MWQDNTLTVEYQTQHKIVFDQISSKPKLQEAEKIISTILARTVKFLVDLKQESDSSNDRGKNRLAAGAKPSQDEIHNARTDPNVRQVMEILGGDIKDVRRLEN